MFAKSLEIVLQRLCGNVDVSALPSDDLARRFDSLRSYGRLPRGRDRRAQRLTSIEIASALIGLVPIQPQWAGHAVSVLSGYLPVGGTSAAFLGAQSLLAMIARLIESPEARTQTLSVSLSMATTEPNMSGSAQVTWLDEGQVRTTFYVSPLAFSALAPGAELRFDPFGHAPLTGRQLSFTRPFFERLAREIDRAQSIPEPPGDGTEYDADDADRARRRRLKIGPQATFLNLGVDTQVDWPKEEMLVSFGGHDLILMPKTAQNTQSVHIDLHRAKLSEIEAMTLINRFLSALTWCDDQFAILQDGFGGGPMPVAVPRRNLGFATTYLWILDREIPVGEEGRKALGLFREGANAAEAGLETFAVLSFYKVIELRFDESRKAIKWINEHVDSVLSDYLTSDERERFQVACEKQTAGSYIWSACRVATAHASVKHPSDVDDAEEIRRLSTAATVLRGLARHFIVDELGIAEGRFSPVAKRVAD